MADDQYTDLKTAVAELKGTVVTEVRHLAHDVKNLSQRIEAVMPRQEAEAKHAGMASNHLHLEKRVEKLENNISRITWAIVMAWLGGLGVAASIGKKMFGE